MPTKGGQKNDTKSQDVDSSATKNKNVLNNEQSESSRPGKRGKK